MRVDRPQPGTRPVAGFILRGDATPPLGDLRRFVRPALSPLDTRRRTSTLKTATGRTSLGYREGTCTGGRLRANPGTQGVVVRGFVLLGEVGIHTGDGVAAITQPRLRGLLAALLVDVNTVL